jgi:tight adherence protein B
VIEGLAVLVTAATAGLVAYAAMLGLRSALASQRQKYLEEQLSSRGDAILYLTHEQRLLLNLASALMCGVVTWLVMGFAAGVIVGFTGLLIPGFYIRRRARQRLEKFNEQLVDALSALSSAFRAGLSFPQAIEVIASEAEEPIGKEFRIAVRELRMGVQMPEALGHIAERTGSDDMALVATTTAVAQGLGGNMAEMFESISKTIADRFRIEGRIRTLTAQGRMQGIVVALLPLILALVMNWMRPDLMQPMMSHWFGWMLIFAILTLDLLGALIIRKIVDIEV